MMALTYAFFFFFFTGRANDRMLFRDVNSQPKSADNMKSSLISSATQRMLQNPGNLSELTGSDGKGHRNIGSTIVTG